MVNQFCRQSSDQPAGNLNSQSTIGQSEEGSAVVKKSNKQTSDESDGRDSGNTAGQSEEDTSFITVDGPADEFEELKTEVPELDIESDDEIGISIWKALISIRQCIFKFLSDVVSLETAPDAFPTYEKEPIVAKIAINVATKIATKKGKKKKNKGIQVNLIELG